MESEEPSDRDTSSATDSESDEGSEGESTVAVQSPIVLYTAQTLAHDTVVSQSTWFSVPVYILGGTCFGALISALTGIAVFRFFSLSDPYSGVVRLQETVVVKTEPRVVTAIEVGEALRDREDSSMIPLLVSPSPSNPVPVPVTTKVASSSDNHHPSMPSPKPAPVQVPLPRTSSATQRGEIRVQIDGPSDLMLPPPDSLPSGPLPHVIQDRVEWFWRWKASRWEDKQSFESMDRNMSALWNILFAGSAAGTTCVGAFWSWCSGKKSKKVQPKKKASGRWWPRSSTRRR